MVIEKGLRCPTKIWGERERGRERERCTVKLRREGGARKWWESLLSNNLGFVLQNLLFLQINLVFKNLWIYLEWITPSNNKNEKMYIFLAVTYINSYFT
jgi:hypothetical protein